MIGTKLCTSTISIQHLSHPKQRTIQQVINEREYLMNIVVSVPFVPTCILNRNRFLSKNFGSFHLKCGWMDGRIYRLYSHFTFTLIFVMLKTELNPKDKELLSAFVHKCVIHVAFNIISRNTSRDKINIFLMVIRHKTSKVDPT